MLDGKGNAVRPDYVSIYYKQRPATDPVVSDPTNAKYLGKAVQLPNGLKFIFGWDPTGVNSIKTGRSLVQLPGVDGKAWPLHDAYDSARQLPRRQSGWSHHSGPGMLGWQESRQSGSPQSRGLCQLWDVGLPEVPVDAPVQHPVFYNGRVVYGRLRRQYEPLGTEFGSHGSGSAQGSHLPCRLLHGMGPDCS